ncbi:hydrolase, TatD family [Sulfurihydrogenibium azorense Az-Fu1]|uniref:Hydrolase, TatD family n=1 Tax=Sulfurihydrogenibium azorense (strain DSM 15241 / OCM 825 / Az-Fu1) TaxID=204536 RepID=C1DWT4_SULAA|nr:TatD family hydrolase [Sulfurihydrogenibium azorense]ACN99382.1 hydrolase, TatD family [Sulfurihydrogenibium azorense Az-Fu1]
MVDTHCHLDMIPLQDVEESVKRLDYLLTIGCDKQEIKKALEIGSKYENVFVAIGYHPYDIGDLTDKDIEELENLIKENSKVIAVGECGLDFYREKTPKDKQEYFFRKQIELAKKLKKPLIIHSRSADRETEKILSEYAPFESGGIMHCFGGDERLMEFSLEAGFYISFAGNITYPKADNLRNILKKVPLDRLLLETDSPFLSPQKVRGTQNKPSNIYYTLEFASELLGIEKSKLEKTTDENFKRLFSLN